MCIRLDDEFIASDFDKMKDKASSYGRNVAADLCGRLIISIQTSHQAEDDLLVFSSTPSSCVRVLILLLHQLLLLPV